MRDGTKLRIAAVVTCMTRLLPHILTTCRTVLEDVSSVVGQGDWVTSLGISPSSG